MPDSPQGKNGLYRPSTPATDTPMQRFPSVGSVGRVRASPSQYSASDGGCEERPDVMEKIQSPLPEAINDAPDTPTDKRPVRLTEAALGKVGGTFRRKSRLEGSINGVRDLTRRGSSLSGMYTIVRKIKSERQRAKTQRRNKGREFSVLSKSQETISHLEGAMRSSILQPDDKWRPIWDLAILFFVAYYWIVVPLQYVIPRHQTVLTTLGHDILEYISTILFCADVYLQFRTAFVEITTGLVIDDPKKISQHYLYGSFTWDILAAIPLDLLVLKAGGESFMGGWLFSLASHLRLLKIQRVASLFKVVNSLKLDARSVQFQFGIVPNLKMAFSSVLALHMITVVFMLMNKESKWGDESEKDFSYTTCLYWTLYTVTSVGYGDIPVNTPWKMRFACVLFIVGVILHGIVISEISFRLQKADVESERRDKMNETLNIMRIFSIPQELQKEVLAFQYHQLHSCVSGAFVKVLESLPNTMRNRVGLYVRVKFICKVPMFAEQPIGCLVDLANALKNLVYEPEQKIIQAGDEGYEMFFLGHGFADVLSPKGEHWGVIRPGGFFGEMALLTECKRTATIKTLTYCDLFSLSKDNFLVIMEKHAELRMAVQEEMEKRQIIQTNQIATVETETRNDSFSDADGGNSARSGLATSRSADELYSPTESQLRKHDSYTELPDETRRTGREEPMTPSTPGKKYMSLRTLPGSPLNSQRKVGDGIAMPEGLPVIAMTPPTENKARQMTTLYDARLKRVEDKLDDLSEMMHRIEDLLLSQRNPVASWTRTKDTMSRDQDEHRDPDLTSPTAKNVCPPRLPKNTSRQNLQRCTSLSAVSRDLTIETDDANSQTPLCPNGAVYTSPSGSDQGKKSPSDGNDAQIRTTPASNQIPPVAFDTTNQAGATDDSRRSSLVWQGVPRATSINVPTNNGPLPPSRQQLDTGTMVLFPEDPNRMLPGRGEPYRRTASPPPENVSPQISTFSSPSPPPLVGLQPVPIFTPRSGLAPLEPAVPPSPAGDAFEDDASPPLTPPSPRIPPPYPNPLPPPPDSL